MNPRELKFLTVAAIVAVGLGLAGCGGGGSSSSDQAATCPEGQVGTPPDCMDPPTPPTAYETAKAAIAAATTAAEAQAAYDAVKDDVTAAEGEKLQALVDEKREAETAQRLEGNKAGELVAEAILGRGTPRTGGHDATSASAFPASIGTLTVPTIKDGGTPTIALRRTTGVKLDAMNTMSPGEGWTGKKFSFAKNQGAAFTNRSAPTVKVTEYGYETFFSAEGAGVGYLTAALDTSSTANGAIMLSTTASFKGSQFSVSGLLPARPSADPVSQPAVTKTLTGSFFGVPGTFACAACTVTRDKNDAITFPAGTLTFTPTKSGTQEFDDLTVMYRTSTPDNDYTQFGYWMTTSGTGDKVKQTIRTFAEAMGYSDDNSLAADVATLRGKATYSGAAAGIYVHKAGSGDSLVVGNGEFVADAALTAQFGVSDGSVAAANQWAVTGTVSGFQSATGNHDLSGWTLMLGKADLGTRDSSTGVAAATNNDFAGFSGKTSGGTGTTAGDWVGTFVGGSPATTDTDTDDDYPLAAIGEFNGHFANGHVAGAFGAEKD